MELSGSNTRYMFLAQRTQSDLQKGAENGKGSDDTKITTTLKGSMGERITKALAKVEEKKQKRALRRSQVKMQC